MTTPLTRKSQVAPSLTDRFRTVVHRVTEGVAWRRKLWRNENWFFGKWVELTGNRFKVDDLVFGLDHPSIRTSSKSQFLFNLYEQPEIALVKKYVQPDVPIIELGGCIGVVSCVANRLLANPSEHVVLEANPAVLDLLKANRDRNGCSFRVEHAALGYASATVEFYINSGFMSGSSFRKTEKKIAVPAITLAQLAAQSQFARFNLLADIEGAEIDLVEHESEVLSTHVQRIMLETHPHIVGEAAVNGMIDRLKSVGFVVLEKTGLQLVMENRSLDRRGDIDSPLAPEKLQP